jgi:hypothetical protein
MKMTRNTARPTKTPTARPTIAGVLREFVGFAADDVVAEGEADDVIVMVVVGIPDIVPEWLGSVFNAVPVSVSVEVTENVTVPAGDIT